MRTWFVLLTLLALVCAVASHREHRVSRKGGHTSRKSHPKGPRQEQTTEGSVAQEQPHIHEEEELSNDQKAALARYVVHYVLSPALGTKMSLKGYKKYVGINLALATDVINGNSTGTPYVYMSRDDYSVWDLHRNNSATMFFTRIAIDKFCHKLPLNAKDPKCARAELMGKIVRLDNGNEKKAAFKSLTDKVPGLKDVEHKDYALGKMDIQAVFVMDHAGKAEEIDLNLYKEAKPEEYYLAHKGRAPNKRIG